MAQATDLGPTAARSGDSRIISLVSAAHFVSHYYILLLPPLFAFIRVDYGVSYTELGLAIAVFNVVSATFQTPTGFLVDRIGARAILVAGLVLGSTAAAVMGLASSFWVMAAMMAFMGLANTVYHPSDYAILSHLGAQRRISHAFSVHTFSGMLGTGLAPAILLFLQSVLGWRGALVASAALGFAVAAALAFQSESLFYRVRPAAKAHPEGADRADAGLRLLLSGPIVRNLLFFVLLALTSNGVSNYSVVALGTLYGTPPAIANTALSSFLLLSAFGVLVGGALAARSAHHGLIASLGLLTTGAAVLIVGFADLGTFFLIIAMGAGGLANGIVMPSRDMIVREVTPPGSFGKVFGFVSTGFNIGGIVSPPILGALMDHGHARGVFVIAGICSLAAILTVATRPRPTALRSSS